MERSRTGFALGFLEQSGWDEEGIKKYRAVLSTPPSDMPFLYDPERPPEAQRNRVFALSDLHEVVRPVEFDSARQMLANLGLQFSDQLRVIVCDGAELLGWVGGFRDSPFAPAEARALARLVPSLRTSLLWRKRLDQANLMRAGLDAAMRAMGCPVFLVRSRGSVAHANDAGERLIGTKGQDVQNELRDALASGRAEAVAVRATGMADHELVILRDSSPRLEGLIARAAEAWSLTPRQREILTLVACGDANKSIATKLGCAEVTIEFHVTALLKKARASSRGELIARVWSGELKASRTKS
ncbi:MAG TPA: helix-turn-helix transcriptional regulator [Labilithrix sp.]|jgi:DNA-binding CsgD family transcriptional regulator|nr:helix-turn-helix transcriptional regulator [Labilithrix sp.]